MKPPHSALADKENSTSFLSIPSVFFAFLLIILFLYPGLFLNFSTKIPAANHNDVKNIISIINYSIHTELSNIYHLPVFYPESFVLARTHPLFGVSLYFKAFQVLGLGLEQSYNLYIILSLLLGAFGCFLLAREFSQNRAFSFLFSALYIVHHKNHLLFYWLNFFSLFYIPYIFYFLLRFYKTKKKVHIFGAALLSLLQTLSSIYYAVQIWAFLIPSFVIFALALRIISLKEVGQVLVFLLAAAIIIFFIFSPFANVTQTQIIKKTDHNLVSAGDLFHYSKIANLLFGSPLDKNLYFFPGFSFFLFVLLFAVCFQRNSKLKGILFFTMLITTALMTFLVYIDLFALELFFLAFLSIIALSVVSSWRDTDKWTKLLILTFSFFLLVMLKFEHLPVLSSISLFDLESRWLPFSGLKAIKRAFIVILPLFIAMAAVGGSRHFRSFDKFSSARKVAFVLIILSLMTAENIRLQKRSTMMLELPKEDANIYQKLPFKKNKVILEIPFYFDRSMPKNSFSMLNWQYHQNPLLNGNTSVVPRDYLSDLRSIIGSRQHTFPTENHLEELIQKYSVTHIIFHWNLIKKRLGDSSSEKNIRTKIGQIGEFGKVIHNDERYTILNTQEFIPISRIIRTYSLYHLKKKRVKILLYGEYTGVITIKLNNRLVQKRKLNSSSFALGFERHPLQIPGNRIEVLFERPVMLKAVELTD